MVVSLSRELGPMVEVLGDEAGMHVAVTLQNGSRDLEIAERPPARTFRYGRCLLPIWARRRTRASSWALAVPALPEIPNAVRKLRDLLAMK